MADFPDVRRAQPNDQERVGALWMEMMQAQAELDARFVVADDALDRWNNDYEMWLADETQRIFVAEPEDAVLGFVTASRWGPPPIYAPSSEVYIDALYVAPNARRQGLGTQLVQAVRHWAASFAAERLRLQTVMDNAAARAFWAEQSARPFTTTLTVELEHSDSEEAPRRAIGF